MSKSADRRTNSEKSQWKIIALIIIVMIIMSAILVNNALRSSRSLNQRFENVTSKVQYGRDVDTSKNEKDRLSLFFSGYSTYTYYYATLGTWFNVILTAGLIALQMYQIISANRQIQKNTNDQIDIRKRDSFFKATAFLNQIIDRVAIGQEKREMAFVVWLHYLIQKCDKKILDSIIAGFEPPNLNWYAEIIVEKLSDFHFPRKAAIDTSSFEGLKSSFDGIGNILAIAEVKQMLMKDFWESANATTKDAIIKESCKASFEQIGYMFGPFFKTVMMILEIANGDDENISLFKAQLTAHQMIALQANAICGLCNKKHDILVKKMRITNDSTMIENPYVKYLNEMYEMNRYINKITKSNADVG